MPALSVRPTGSLRGRIRKPIGPHRTQHASFGGQTARVQRNSKLHLRALAELTAMPRAFALHRTSHLRNRLRPTGFFKAENVFRPFRKSSSRVYQHRSQHILDPSSRKRGQKFTVPVLARTKYCSTLGPLGADPSEQFRCFATGPCIRTGGNWKQDEAKPLLQLTAEYC